MGYGLFKDNGECKIVGNRGLAMAPKDDIT